MSRPRKPRPPEPGDDEIRNKILEFLYQQHKGARSADGARATMGEVKKAMKPLAVKQHRIVSNLLYIVQTRWAEERVEEYTVYRDRRAIPVKRVAYRISAAGIDRFEGPSAFQQVDRIAGINVTNIAGVTVVGQGNVVTARFEGLFRDLDALGTAIRASDLPDRDKLSYQAEVETIKSQLMKEQPDRATLARAWDGLKGIATISGVAAAFERVRDALQGLLS